MKKHFSAFVIVVFIYGCASKQAAKEYSQQADTTTNTKIFFFPVTSFLKGQMLQFDSIPITPLRITTIKEKTDSEWVKREQLKTFLQTFLTPEINELNLTQYFKETKFNDLTINAITFTYTPLTTLPDSINLLSWNVYINPQTQNVTKVYLAKKIKEDNHTIIQLLTWQTDKYAEITTILDNSNGSSELLKKEKFIWNFNQ